MRLDRITLAGLSGALLLGCHGAGSAPPTTTTVTTSGAHVGPNESAITSIATARCDREVACTSVGPDHPYATRDACMNAMLQEGQEHLGEEDCAAAIPVAQTDACIAAVRSERCGSPLATLTGLRSCQTSVLCARP